MVTWGMAEAPMTRLAIVVPPGADTDEEFQWLMAGIDDIGTKVGLELRVNSGNIQVEPAVGLFWHRGDVNFREDISVDDRESIKGKVTATNLQYALGALALIRLQETSSNRDMDSAPMILREYGDMCASFGFNGAGRFVIGYRDRTVFLSRIHEFIYRLLESRGERESKSGTSSFDPETLNIEAGEETERVLTEQASIAVGGVSDHVALVDTLGFKPYVRAVAMFLRHKRTTPPFTMSIDGEWGCGKSSFMRQLQTELETPETLKDQATWVNGKPNLPEGWKKPITIWFNPWRHDKDESLWAAFALTCLRVIPKQLGAWGRQAAYWRRMWRRIKKPAALEGLLKTIGKYVVAAGACVALFLYSNELAQKIAGGDQALFIERAFGGTALGALLLTATRLWKLVEPVVKEPIAADLAQHLKAPDYASKVAYLEQFHEEFSASIRDLAPDRDVFVFIDDLDRCEVPRAAELMQAINLLTASDAPLYFIIGMDREKVAAGVAAKHKPVLEYLDGVKGLDFGYNFIQKFIQLPFRVPKPTGDQLERMLDTVVGGVEVVDPTIGTKKRGTAEAGGTESRLASAGPSAGASTSGASEQEVPAAIVRQRVVQIKDFERDSDKIKKLIRLVAPFLDHNPRRVKQFAGLFRLQYYLAVETGLCDRDAADPKTRPLSIEQVGKFTALAYLWPRTIERLEAQPNLLTLWEQLATGRRNPDTDELARLPDGLIEFLKLGFFPQGPRGQILIGPKEMFMEGVDVVRLLRVASPTPWILATDDATARAAASASGTVSVTTGAVSVNDEAKQQVISPEGIESSESFGEPNMSQQSAPPGESPHVQS